MGTMASKPQIIFLGIFEPLQIFLWFSVGSSKPFGLKTHSPAPDKCLVPAIISSFYSFAASQKLFLSLSHLFPSCFFHSETQRTVLTLCLSGCWWAELAEPGCGNGSDLNGASTEPTQMRYYTYQRRMLGKGRATRADLCSWSSQNKTSSLNWADGRICRDEELLVNERGKDLPLEM